MVDNNKLLLIIIILNLIGIFLGLIVRLIREKTNISNFYYTLNYSIKFLIIYPLIFPLILLMNKKEFSEMMAEMIISDNKSKGLKVKISKRDLSRIILNDMTFKIIIQLSFNFNKSIIKNYDNYVKTCIALAKDRVGVRNNIARTRESYFKEEVSISIIIENIYKSNFAVGYN